MKKTFWASILLATGIAANAANGTRVLENGIEAQASAIIMPQRTDGRLQFQGCPTCKLYVLQLTEKTRFLIGDRDVSFDQLIQHISARPDAAVLIVTPKSQSVVTRIKVAPDAVVK
jgi:hypothetical protein